MSRKRKTYSDFLNANFGRLFGAGDDNKGAPVVFSDEARSKHSVLYGDIGSGKSRLITALAATDAFRRVKGLSPRGFAVLDNQEDLFNDIADRLALMAQDYPALYDFVHIVDPTNPKWSVKYNPLELMPWETADAKAQHLANVFANLFGDDTTTNVRQYRVSKYTFLPLIVAGYSLLQVPDFLTDRAFREELVEAQEHHYPELGNYWRRQFPRDDARAMEWIESTMNRVERFISMSAGLQFMLEGPSTINLRHIMDGGGILLVNAPIRVLKDNASSLFLAFILAALQDAAMSRTDVSRRRRTPFTAYCDEFQEYTTVTVQQTARLARKVNFELFLATQDVQGLPQHREVRALVSRLVGNTLAMRLSYGDAQVLANTLFAPGLVQEKAVIDGKPVYFSLSEIQEMEIRKITQCPDRMAYWKRKGDMVARYFMTPTVLDIESVPNFHRLAEARRQLADAAFKLSGRPKVRRLPPPRANGHVRSGQAIDVPLWDES